MLSLALPWSALVHDSTSPALLRPGHVRSKLVAIAVHRVLALCNFELRKRLPT